jgi:hypothetical protein
MELATNVDDVNLSGIVSETKWDVCFVFPVDKEKNTFTANGFQLLNDLSNAGFEFLKYFSAQKDEIYVLGRVRNDALATFADKIDFKVLLDEAAAEEAALAGYPPNIAPFKINSSEMILSEITKFRPFECIYSEYDADPTLQKLYHKKPGATTPFVNAVRLKLTQALIEAPKFQFGSHIAIQKKIKSGDLLGFFPLHNEDQLSALYSEWIVPFAMPASQPYEGIREYFGEKIALYFKFIGNVLRSITYPMWLIVLYLLLLWQGITPRG